MAAVGLQEETRSSPSLGLALITQNFRGEDGDMQFTVLLRVARLHSIVVMCPSPG